MKAATESRGHGRAISVSSARRISPSCSVGSTGWNECPFIHSDDDQQMAGPDGGAPLVQAIEKFPGKLHGLVIPEPLTARTQMR